MNKEEQTKERNQACYLHLVANQACMNRPMTVRFISEEENKDFPLGSASNFTILNVFYRESRVVLCFQPVVTMDIGNNEKCVYDSIELDEDGFCCLYGREGHVIMGRLSLL